LHTPSSFPNSLTLQDLLFFCTLKKRDDFVHTLIIGGGIGGLTAAALLAKTGQKVTVLEASSKWGGCAVSRWRYT